MIFSFLRRHAWWLIPLLIFDFFLFRWLLADGTEGDTGRRGRRVSQQVEIPARSRDEVFGLRYGYPTDQQELWNTESAVVYQPTASGRVESALYGSVRTRSSGGRLLPAFHMGIDIASLERDRRGRPLDKIYAVADGRVGYVNRVGGNSSYGIYIVLLHDDPLGEIYTLYSHMARVEPGIKEGVSVSRGDVLGVMGNTASTGIPMVRAHLHFEIGVVYNARFRRWYRAQELVPDHGVYHGWNLTGIDPLAVFGEKGQEEIRFNLRTYLWELEPAFALIVRTTKPLDYFERYPDLWDGQAFFAEASAIVMTVSESGMPLSGRMASPEEVAALDGDRAQVLEVDEEVLGRNGMRYVVQRGDSWEVGRNAERWLDILTQ